MSNYQASPAGSGCDVLCQEGPGGYVIRVSTIRTENQRAAPPPGLANTRRSPAWTPPKSVVRIGLPHDGATYIEPTPAKAADRLDTLRKAGYRVPLATIARLRNGG